jgi:4-amino-4-deoxy-L-arabinose transferase-like glycosyltransferase
VYSLISKCTAAALLLYSLYFFGLGATGMVGPDEPRYASIAREMALSGDWITPRLWGAPWFEKPALLYWMGAAFFKLGFGADLAPRLPVALLSAAFLTLFFFVLRHEFGEKCAWLSACILATSGGWLAFSQVATTDLPMAATFSAAMVLCLPWLRTGDRSLLPWAGVCLGLAVLGKGLVPLVLAAPLAYFAVRKLRDWVWPALACAATAAPWYVLCTLINGRAFLDEFFLKHHFQRFASDSLQHVQPVWFYAPVLLAGLLPWTPLAATFFQRENWSDRRRRFLVLWLIWGFVFFSASTNKLPGYLLPLLPACAALMGLGLAQARTPQRWLAGVAALLGFIPLAAAVLPRALASGLSRVDISFTPLVWLLPAALLGLLLLRMDAAKASIAAVTAVLIALLYLKVVALPAVDANASARQLWREIEPRRDEICVGEIHRAWRYGLNYYSVTPLPECSVSPRAWRVVQNRGERPAIVASPAQ